MSSPRSARDGCLLVSRVIAAEREAVFRAWTEADQLVKWFGPEGATVTAVEVEASPGGRYRIRLESSDGGVHTVGGTYREVDFPSRLVFTWNWEEEAHRMDVESLVTVEFLERDGGTEVRITHEQLPDAASARGHREGWISTLSCLSELFA